MNHTPTLTADVYRCECGFYAVVTTNGLHVICSGSDRQLHIDRITQAQVERNAYVERVMTRLRKQYAEKRPLPEADDNYDDLVAAGVMDPRTLSLRQLQRLYKFIVAEYM